jgi:hypothetical protein
MATAPPEIARAYIILLDRAIVHLRHRIRSGDTISSDELHDWLDALHNIPTLLNAYGSGGGWFCEENIDWALARYDERWLGEPSAIQRMGMIKTLTGAKNGDFELPKDLREATGTD